MCWFSIFGPIFFRTKDSMIIKSICIAVAAGIVAPASIASAQEDQRSCAGEHECEAVVERVVDGDTIVLESGERVRYIGIDTPETVHPSKPEECFGAEATKKNTELVEGKRVLLVQDVSDTDRYGRLLRYVYVQDVFVNNRLVEEGYAYASSYPPDVDKQEQLRKSQEEARRTERGLWAPGACADVRGARDVQTGEDFLHAEVGQETGIVWQILSFVWSFLVWVLE
jgi:micrococcal nuclease